MTEGITTVMIRGGEWIPVAVLVKWSAALLYHHIPLCISVPTESESGGDKENGRRSTASSLSYDDIAEEENVPAQPASSGEDGTSSPGPGAGPSATHGNIKVQLSYIHAYMNVLCLWSCVAPLVKNGAYNTEGLGIVSHWGHTYEKCMHAWLSRPWITASAKWPITRAMHTDYTIQL